MREINIAVPGRGVLNRAVTGGEEITKNTGKNTLRERNRSVKGEVDDRFLYFSLSSIFLFLLYSALEEPHVPGRL